MSAGRLKRMFSVERGRSDPLVERVVEILSRNSGGVIGGGLTNPPQSQTAVRCSFWRLTLSRQRGKVIKEILQHLTDLISLKQSQYSQYIMTPNSMFWMICR